jgi:hypothetical protein
MNRFITITAIAALSLAGCMETASETKRDVTEARQEAAESNDDARVDASRDVAEANERMDSMQQDRSAAKLDADKKMTEVESGAMIAKARADYDIAMTEAKGRHQVSKEKCDALDRVAKNACVKRIDTTLTADQSLATSNRDAAILAAEYNR